MAEHALYNPQGLLIALGPYVVPVRLGVYLLNMPGPRLQHLYGLDYAVVGIDIFGKGLSAPGGTLEAGEKLLEAGFGEYAEECGGSETPYLVSARSLNFLSTNFKGEGQQHLDDETAWEPVIGQDYKLRCYLRTACNSMPLQQPPAEGMMYPELVNPHFEPVANLLTGHRIMRKSFRQALMMAQAQRLLFVPNTPVTGLDYGQIATDWEKLKIHPDIIAFFCGEPDDYSSSAEKVMEGLMKNLRYAEQGLKHLLRHKLPYHEQIRGWMQTAKTN